MGFSPEDEILNYDGDEENFWDEEESEWSEPVSGDEGATRDIWYHRRLLVMWPKSNALRIKCTSLLKFGIAHVTKTVDASNSEIALNEADQLCTFIEEKNKRFHESTAQF